MMLKKIKNAFTLSEVLLTVVIVGILTTLVLPGLIKDMNAKSRMALLRTTVLSLNDMIHKEITEQRTNDISLTNIVTNPQTFLNKFEKAESSDNAFASSYRSIDGSDVENPIIPENKVLLKNGASLGLISQLYDKNSTGVVIDINGSELPNMVGVDYFIAELVWNDDTEKGLFSGDVHGYEKGNDATSDEESDLKTSCKAGNGAACFRLAELTGYDPKYIEE